MTPDAPDTADAAAPPPAPRENAVASLGAAALNALMSTCRYGREGVEHYDQFWRAGKPVIFTLWHGRLLPCTHYHRQQGVVTLISQHRDGEYITRVVRRWGYTAVRGSTTCAPAARWPSPPTGRRGRARR